MRRRGVLVVVAALLLAPASAAIASASTSPSDAVAADSIDPSWDPPQFIENYRARYYVHSDGAIDVTIDFAFNFGIKPGHGPYLTYPIRVPYDEANYRLYRISDFRVSSPSGAPADVNREVDGDWVRYRIGDPRVGNLVGEHRYHVTYTVDGLLDAITARDYDPSLAAANDTTLWDELYLDVIGAEWDIPIVDVAVTVEGDAKITSVTPPGSTEAIDARCFSGDTASTEPCSSSAVVDGVATFAQNVVLPGQSMTVAVAFPAGSVDATPILRNTNGFLYAFSVNGRSLAGFAGVLLLSMAWLVWRLRGAARDERFGGVTPGLAPAPGDDPNIVRGDDRSTVAVQFEPPRGLRPGHLGTLVDESADVRDVTATIVDLAVRGYLRIEAGITDDADYTFVKLKDADDSLLEYEATLFRSLFGRFLGTADKASLGDLALTFAADLHRVQSQLFDDVTGRGWFRGSPAAARARWRAWGITLTTLGAALTIAFAVAGPWGIVPLPIVLVGVATLLTTKAAPARTAEGSRVLAQTRGFLEFLSTADGNTLRFEEKHDIFSEYLPFAIAFGVADRWTETFAELAKAGVKLPGPRWLAGSTAKSWTTSAGFLRRVRGVTKLGAKVMAYHSSLAGSSAGPGGAWGFGIASESRSRFGRHYGGFRFGGARRSGFSRRGFSGGGRFGGGGGRW